MADRPLAGVALVTLVGNGTVVASGRVGADRTCGLELVDGLLRLELLAGRGGWSVRLSGVAEELGELLDLVGVADRFA